LVEREEARRLRREDGLAVRVIAERLSVSKTSVSLWTRDIELTEEQHERLRRANPIHNQQHRGQEGRRATARWARLAAQEHGRAQAGQGDLLHLQGCMLFWAESSWRRNVHVYGTAALCVHSTYLVQSIYGAIQEYGGFERPRGSTSRRRRSRRRR
jgi:hypothetical protein